MIAELLNMEESKLTVHVDAGQRILKAGSFDPYIQFEIAAIKSFDDEADKIVVIFHRPAPEDVGIKGTLSSILRKN
ncbi:Hypp814 [Branchiostoma lanceolatum]|uniref:Hypp814 protein n=1 Tax=Branchiostoma lanceolatum TaxID=7740 RepID=A0A8J9YQJ3_BRALA|nr:Hypp814 [Branchiostoma lanceolatum]